MSFRDIMGNLIGGHSGRQIKRLIISTAILNFATAAVSLFEPIYLYNLGFSLVKVLAYYLCGHLLIFLLLPLGAKLSTRLGLHRAILLSSPLLIVYYLSLFAIKYHWTFAILAIIALGVQTILYYPNFHQEMTHFGNDGERGREISRLNGLAYVAAIAGPAFGGLVIAGVGFPVLFVIASILILASNIPLLTIPEDKPAQSFDFRAVVRRLGDSGGRKVFVSMFGYGEELFALVVWPIFMFGILKGFAATGAIASISIVISTAAILYIGRLSDLQSRHALLKTGTIFTAAAWLGRLFLRTPIGVLGSDAFYRVSKNLAVLPQVAILYSRAKKDSPLESIIFFEMGIAAGKAAAAGYGIILLSVFPGSYGALFVLAAAMSLLYAVFP